MSIGERLAVSADFNSLFLRFLRKDRVKTNLTIIRNDIDLAVQTVNVKESCAICWGALVRYKLAPSQRWGHSPASHSASRYSSI